MNLKRSLRSPLRPAALSPLQRALVGGGAAPAPPASTTYGATADAGEVNTSDTIAGTLYYTDAVSGLDTYNGLSKYAGYMTNPDGSQGTANAAYGPFQTLAKQYAYTILGGAPAAVDSAFMLKRGDSYNGFISLNKAALSTSKYLTGAWSTGARPVIRYVNSAAQANTILSVAWGNRGYERLRNLSLDAKYVVQANVGTVTGSAPTAGQVITGGTSGATGVFQYANGVYWNIELTSVPTTYASLETLSWSGGSAPVTAATVNSAQGVGFTLTGEWEVSKCEVAYCAGNGILIGTNQAVDTANNILIQNTIVHDACRAQSNGAGIDGGGIGNPASMGAQSSLIESNTVYDCGIAGYITNHNIYLANLVNTTIRLNWSYMTLNRGNFALVIHGVNDTVLIEKNLFEKCNNGVGINKGYGTAERFDNFTVRQNINRLNGSIPGQGQGYSALLESVRYSAFYNNLNYSNDLGADLYIGGGAAVNSADVVFSHEVYYNQCLNSTVVGAFSVRGSISGVIVQNSIFMSTAASGFLLDIDASAVAAGTIVRNCVFYMPNNAGNAIKWNGTSYTIAAWMTLYGTANGCLQVDPLFVSAATDDFRLQAGSPCKLAGYNSGITTDFADNARHATTPSIGAYE